MTVSEEVEKVVGNFINEPQLKDKTEGMGRGLLLAARLADESNQLTNNIQKQVDNIVVNGDSSVEAAQARVDGNGKSFSTLKKRLDEKEKENVLLTAEKASTSYVNQLVSSLSENGPYDAVTTVSALYAKYPNGAPGPILVFANNHSYIWSENTWKDFGTYQGIELKDGTVTPTKTNFFIPNEKNLVHPLDFTTGYVDGTGSIVPAGTSRVSQQLISINPNSYYRLQSDDILTNTTIYIATYLNGVFRTRYLFNNTENAVFQTGPNDQQYRISCIGGDEFKLYLHEGTNHLPHQTPLIIDEQYVPSTMLEANQTDFVALLKKHNQTNQSLKAKITGDRVFWVYQPISNGRYVGHHFVKNTNDDFVVYASAAIGKFENGEFQIEQYMMAGSNKEFAIRVRPYGSTGELRWLPEHENIGTSFSIKQSVLFDGVEKGGQMTAGVTENVFSVQLIQEMNLIYPGESLPTAKLNLVTTINSEGVSYTGKIKWLKSTEVERGYVAMLPAVTPPVDTLRTSLGNDYNASLISGLTTLAEDDLATSYAFFNKNGTNSNTSYVLSQTIHNPDKTFRKGKVGRKEPNTIWLEHRSDSAQKLYPQIYLNHTALVDEVLEFGSTVYVGILPMASSLLF